MNRLDIVRAWKDADYRESLSDAERAALPQNPAGLMELPVAALGKIAGGGPLDFKPGTVQQQINRPVTQAAGSLPLRFHVVAGESSFATPRARIRRMAAARVGPSRATFSRARISHRSSGERRPNSAMRRFRALRRWTHSARKPSQQTSEPISHIAHAPASRASEPATAMAIEIMTRRDPRAGMR